MTPVSPSGNVWQLGIDRSTDRVLFQAGESIRKVNVNDSLGNLALRKTLLKGCSKVNQALSSARVTHSKLPPVQAKTLHLTLRLVH